MFASVSDMAPMSLVRGILFDEKNLLIEHTTSISSIEWPTANYSYKSLRVQWHGSSLNNEICYT